MMGSDSAFKSEILRNIDELESLLQLLGNRRRIRIMAELTGGSQSFQGLLRVVNVKKTALSNHLARLLNGNLIKKPDYGQYEITNDGRLFLRSALEMWTKSHHYTVKELEKTQERGFSEGFFQTFFQPR